ncbi:conserved hypothetical protein [Trichophyton verrucosum HKI 0517]|uniref:GDS1 winged helix domain-containing protein n=1 Tax=Trichophyton verrucosum (strain HKI 0517) TaxID=663202 RepID=D4D008_TRIVH|nr:uncharacterized protein TRV_00402 [Trichophyton verrucosum HKI 0517]EFE44801.1 conserved hypothetical protein [Trichophyton verrucosum HKI 0517]
MAAPSSPVSKKQKRAHEADGGLVADRQQQQQQQQQQTERLTPPPSPSQDTQENAQANAQVNTQKNKIDTDGIADDIVVAVIQQLEKTGNRPHLIKELAQVLSATTDSIAKLSLYLKRPWTPLAPCPIAKELIPVHPRKVFFYLTNTPRQPLPASSQDILSPAPSPSVEKEVTPCPSLSLPDLDRDGEDDDEEDRSRMSLSPEVDLDYSLDMMMASDSFASSLPLRQQQHSHSHGHRISHNHRAASPPLEGDEREFTLTASMVRERTTGDDGQAGKLRGLLLDSPPASLDLQVDMDASPYLDGQAASDQGEYGHHQYDDYFSRPIDIPTATTTTTSAASAASTSTSPSEAPEMLYSTSPSPSVASEISFSSLTTTATSDCDSDEDVKPATARLRAHKRTYDMSFPLDVIDLDPRKQYSQLSLDCAFSFSLDSWADFRSPETVEVDELDAIFADI